MCRSVTLEAEVFLGGNNAIAKAHHPQAIDRDARDERILGVRRPLSEAESIFRQMIRKRHHSRWRRGLHRLREIGRSVVATSEDVVLARMFRFLHAHDEREFFQVFIVELLARLRDLLASGCDSGVDVIEIKILQYRACRAVTRLRSGEGGVDVMSGEMSDFPSGEGFRENGKVIDLSLSKAAVIARARGHAEGIGGDGLIQMIAQHLSGRQFAIVEQLHAIGARSAIVGDSDMDPLADGKRFRSFDRGRAAGPNVDAAPAEFALFQQEFKTGGIGGLRIHGRTTVQNHRAIFLFRCENPHRNAEWVMTCDARDAVEHHGGIAIELQCLTNSTRHRFVARSFKCGGCGAGDGIGGFPSFGRVERVMRGGCRRRKSGGRGEPGFKFGIAAAAHRLLLFLSLLPSSAAFRGFCFLRRVHQAHGGWRGGGVDGIRIKARFIDLAKHRRHAEVVGLRQGIVFVVVALRAFHGQAEEGSTVGVDAVRDIFHAEFFRDRAALLRLAVESIEQRRELLFLRGVGQQIAGNLPCGELIEGQVFVKGIDHPVAIGPDKTIVVRLVAVGISKACDIEPILSESFTIAR